jgi:hypothetical protein
VLFKYAIVVLRTGLTARARVVFFVGHLVITDFAAGRCAVFVGLGIMAGFGRVIRWW